MGRNFLSDIGNGFRKILPVAQTVGNFFGPTGKMVSAGLGLLGGLIGSGDDQKKADAAAAKQQEMANLLTGQYKQYSPALIDQMLRGSGYDPATGKYNENYNPMDPALARFSDTAINDRAKSLYDPASANAQIAAYNEGKGNSYDTGVSNAYADAARRGFTGPDTATFGNVANIRAAQASDSNANMRDTFSRLMDARRNYTTQQQDMGTQIQTQGLTQKQNNTERGLTLLGGSAQSGLGTLGGLQGVYASNAQQSAKGVGDLMQEASKAGVFDAFGRKVKKDPNTGGSLGGSTAQPPSPIGGSNQPRIGSTTYQIPVNKNFGLRG